MRRPPTPQEPKFYPLEDGTLSNAKAERHALQIADGVSPSQSWVRLGGRVDGGSFQYRRKMEVFPIFMERLAALKQERETFMAEGELYGEAKWMAKQLWREGRATGNATMMQKGAEMWMKIVDKQGGAVPAVDAPIGATRPGKPSVDNPQANTGVDAIRQRLIALGGPVPRSGDPAVTDPALAVPVTSAQTLRVTTDPGQMVDDFDAKMARMIPG